MTQYSDELDKQIKEESKKLDDKQKAVLISALAVAGVTKQYDKAIKGKTS